MEQGLCGKVETTGVEEALVSLTVMSLISESGGEGTEEGSGTEAAEL